MRGGGDLYGGDRERILALAGTADRAEHARPQGSRGAPETRRDRSLEALQRQIAALDVPRFEVGIREAKTGQMMNREWSRAEVEQSTAWLKRMNAKGNDIYIRPAGEHGLVLLDDLKPAALRAMARDGFAAAAAIETSLGNFQAWVKLSDKALPADVRHLAARGLAQRYGGDPNSADSRHYGRLAGFTNQKPEHTREGHQPYVLAHDCPGNTASAAPAYLAHIGQARDKHQAKKEREKRLETLQGRKMGYGASDPVQEYQKQAQRLLARFGADADLSRMDWMIATDMAQSGRFSVQAIEKSIRECSPNVESRKVGHLEDYAKRTAEKAWAAPEVQQEREQKQEQARQAQHKQQDRGMSR